MDAVTKTKLKFVVSLNVRHSKAGIRSICNRLAMEHFDKLHCRPQDNVLYVGCGAGEEAVILATRVQNVVGIDVDPSILEIAKTDYPADNVEYLLDNLGDASPSLLKWKGAFDKVVSISRIKLFPEMSRVIGNMVGCLKAGGEMLAIIPNNDFNFFDGAAKIIKDYPELGQKMKERNVMLWHKTEEEAEKLLREICDWSQLSCKTQRFNFSLTEDKAKLVWLDGIEDVDRVGKSNQKACLEAMWQWAQVEYGCNKDGVLNKPSEFMVVYGVKKN
ncbi:uncharacterized protein LOC119744527 [Patiria miniata]|uniref:Methyltransferase domain-containing protein n=1 Tax=Patiria miniata TaxID=46514 RepID=A0A914BLR8_PATMI|nr:uncharacterized protein LOC119744527 [Patiria miniata]